jgi:hypothetical protein
MPSALARSSCGNALFTIDTETVKIAPPPMPCTTRAQIRKMSVGAAPQPIEPTTKSTTPPSAILRRPTMSARRPKAIIGDTNASR